MPIKRINDYTARFEGDEGFALPAKCIVCGSPHVLTIQYVQYNAPIIFPGLGVARWVKDVSLPYCEAHSARLRRRHFWLRAVQLLTIAITVGFVFVMPQLALEYDFLGLQMGVFLVALMVLLASVYVVRPRMYDAVYYFDSTGLCLRSNSKEFIDSLIQANTQASRPTA